MSWDPRLRVSTLGNANLAQLEFKLFQQTLSSALVDLWLQAWSDCVSFGDFESYRDRFERIQRYFAPRFPEAVRIGNEMMKTILEKTGTS